MRWREGGGGKAVARIPRIPIFASHVSRLACVSAIVSCVSLFVTCSPYTPVPRRVDSLTDREADCVSQPRGDCCSRSTALSLEWLLDCEPVRLLHSWIPLFSPAATQINLNSVSRSFPTQPATLSPEPTLRQTRSRILYHQIISLYRSCALQPLPSSDATSTRDGNLGFSPTRSPSTRIDATRLATGEAWRTRPTSAR